MGFNDSFLNYRPIELPIVHIPKTATGVEIKGNRTTTSGRSFLAAMTNLLQGSFKLTAPDDNTDFGQYMEGAEFMMGLTFPGLEGKPGAGEFQHISYLGTQNRRTTWAELIGEVDYDFDGTADATSYDEAFPLALYRLTGALTGRAADEAVDYSEFWRFHRSTLSSTATIWQTIVDGSYRDADSPAFDSFEERMTFVLAALEMKRRWAYGLNVLGVNVFDSVMSLDETNWQSSGGFNVQHFWDYIKQSNDVITRMGKIFGAEIAELPEGEELPEVERAADEAGRAFFAWARDTVFPELVAHLRSVSVVTRDVFFARFMAGRTSLDAVLAEISRIDSQRGFSSSRLQAAKSNPALLLLNSELNTLSSVVDACRSRLLALRRSGAADGLIADAEAALRRAQSDVVDKREEIGGLIEEIITLQDDTAAIAGAFWHEFSMAPEDAAAGYHQPFAFNIEDEDVLADIEESKRTVRSYVKEVNSFVQGLMMSNILNKRINNQNNEKVNDEKDEKFYSDVAEKRAEAKQIAKTKTENNKLMSKVEQAGQARRRSFIKEGQRPKANKVKEKEKVSSGKVKKSGK